MSREKLCILPALNDRRGDMSKQWFVYYSYKDPKSGKMVVIKHYKGFTACRTKKAKYAFAEKLIQEYTEKLTMGWNPLDEAEKVVYSDQLKYAQIAKVYSETRKSNRTFNFLSNEFLKTLSGSAKRTYDNYVSKYRHFNTWLEIKNFSDNDITTITQPIMEEFFLYLINDPKYKLARITLKKYEHMLGRFFDWTVKKKFIRQSPMFDIPDTRKVNDKAPHPIHEGDIDDLVKEIKKDRQLYLAIQLEYYCFLRPGQEIRFAKVSWFDLAGGRIHVPSDVVKTKMTKTVIIPEVFRKYLVSEWKLHLFPSDYFVIGKNGVPGPEPVGSNNLRNRFNVIRDRLELPIQYKLYSWKHTGNSRAADAGISLYDTQRQNGHTSIRSTEEYLKKKIGFKSPDIQFKFPALINSDTRSCK